MKKNNVNVTEVKKFVEKVKKNPLLAKRSRKIVGSWDFEVGKPQFASNLEFSSGNEVVYTDQAIFMGGNGVKPDPIQYCLFGLAACYAATFVSIATMEEIYLNELKVTAENQVDLSKTLGLSDNPIVERVNLKIEVRTDTSEDKIKEIEELAKEQCPGVFCLTNPIALETQISVSS